VYQNLAFFTVVCLKVHIAFGIVE